MREPYLDEGLNMDNKVLIVTSLLALGILTVVFYYGILQPRTVAVFTVASVSFNHLNQLTAIEPVNGTRLYVCGNQLAYFTVDAKVKVTTTPFFENPFVKIARGLPDASILVEVEVIK